MAGISADESIISKKNDRDSIIKNSNLRDTEIGTSTYNTEDMDNHDSANRRFIRQQAKHYIDRVIEHKLEDPKLAEAGSSIEEALARIAMERQLEREQYRASIQTENKRKKKKRRRDIFETPKLTLFVESTEPAEEAFETAEASVVVEAVETAGTVEAVDASDTMEVALGAVEAVGMIEAAEALDAIETAETEAVEALETVGTVEAVDASDTMAVTVGAAEAVDTTESTEVPDNRLDLYIDGILLRMQTCLRFIVSFVHAKGKHISLRMGRKIAPVTAASAKRAGLLGNRICIKEAYLSDKMAAAVDRTDLFVDKLFNKAAHSFNVFMQKQRQGRDWCEAHKRQLLGSVAALAVISGSVALGIGHITAYEYMYNGKVMGIVKDQQDVYRTIDIIGDKLTYAYGAEISIDKEKDISFRKVMGFGLELDCKEDILNQFTYLRDMNATAYAILADGEQKAILYSEKCAEKILNEIQNTYLQDSDSIEYESVGFEEKVEIVEVNTKIGNIQDEEKVLEYMLTGAVEIKTYEVKQGDTLGEIAKNLGMSSDELMAANPGVNPTRLQIGQELILNRVCPVLTVRTTEVAEYTVPIDYEVIYEETSTLYKGEQAVKSSGVKGERHVVAQIVRNNGEEVSRNELSSRIITEPKAQVVLKGTKDLPPLIGTGKFIYPARGTTLTSRFGPRWGRIHKGIDLAAPTGTKIRAADGGKVISAGWEGALGYCVRIDHGQNRVTVYGHCSKLFVKKGDRVYQDQHIANIGNTGRSTGPHLHFEVHINGVAQNPLKYLP
jgi:murein DD-endopeptidase MepM/ murein hydrolase activator NlpD